MAKVINTEKAKIQLKNFDQANDALGQIKQLKADISEAEGKYDKKVAKAKQELEEAVQTKREQLLQYEQALESFAEANRDELSETVKLFNGEIGFRKNPPSVELPKNPSEAIAQLIKDKKTKAFIKTTYTLDKKPLLAFMQQSQANAVKLLNWGIKLVADKTTFFYKTK